jgi:hypothetical protein
MIFDKQASEGDVQMNGQKRFDGYLFAKLNFIGSKSEGPIYFLQRWDYGEVLVVKKVHPWELDPSLHDFIAKKVTIMGTLDPNGIIYDEIMDLQPPVEEEDKKPEVSLTLEGLAPNNILWVNKMPPAQAQLWHKLGFCLRVKWPYRSIWTGVCPTTQIYDFFVEREDEVIWQWSNGKHFSPTVTKIEIPGPNEVDYREAWYFSHEEIESEGDYIARGLFIASGQEVTEEFEVKFAG